MYKERILRLADIIERRLDEMFNMGGWSHCIAGFCHRHLTEVTGSRAAADTVFARAILECGGPSTAGIARVALELTNAQMERLFVGDMFGSRAQAVATLRHFAETGEIDWRAPVPSQVRRSLIAALKRIVGRVERQERTIRTMEREARQKAQVRAPRPITPSADTIAWATSTNQTPGRSPERAGPQRAA